MKSQDQASRIILTQALKMGASLAGVVNAADLRRSPSHHSFQNTEVTIESEGSFVVIALEHPTKRPSVDWWDGNQGTAGNRKLIHIANKLSKWISKKQRMTTRILPYHFKQSSLFIKDAAVLAGLGVIGRNNLVITPRYGPKVRFKAIHVSRQFISFTQESFRPCESCAAPCIDACPQNAFVNGKFDSHRCLRQMRLNEDNSTPLEIPGVIGRWGICIQYCRACELACPIGSGC